MSALADALASLLPAPALRAVLIVGAMMALFVWGRLRFDVVALLALLAALAAGVVKPEAAFRGFGDDVVLIVASALVISAAITRSGVVEQAARRLAPRLTTLDRQVGALALMVAALSAVMKNIGALSMLMPVAARLSRRHGSPISRLLMPMAFASLLGGLVTLVGASPDIIVSKIRQDMTGAPYGMFDFTPVGLPLAIAGVALLVLTHRLLGAGARKPGGDALDAAYEAHGYRLEARVEDGSPAIGRPVEALAAEAGGEVEVEALVRGEHTHLRRPGRRLLRAGDRLILAGDPADLQAFVERAGLSTPADRLPLDPASATSAAATFAAAPAGAEPDEAEAAVVEAVVASNSMLIDWTPAQLRLHERFGVTLVAVSRAGEQGAQRLKSFRFRAGDLVVMRLRRSALAETLALLGCLPLAGRHMPLGARTASYWPLAVVVAAMALMAMGHAPVAPAFFGAAVILMLTGAIPPREAYAAIDWPVLVALGALIPVSDSMRSTGATEMISAALAHTGAGLPPLGAVALTMMATMAVTPFLNNAATVLVMGPIAAGLAMDLGHRPDPYLMAVAIGAACDFLTPVGHQCNMLVWGPGGYRFGDYWRLGLPLSVLVVALGAPLVLLVWPLAPP